MAPCEECALTCPPRDSKLWNVTSESPTQVTRGPITLWTSATQYYQQVFDKEIEFPGTAGERTPSVILTRYPIVCATWGGWRCPAGTARFWEERT